MTHTNPQYNFKYPRAYSIDTTREYDPNAANIFDDDQFSTSVSVSGTLESYSLIITGIETSGISTGQYIKTIDEIIQPGTSVLSIGIGSVFINQESLNADSVTTTFEFGSYPLYSDPESFPNLKTDNLLVNDYLFMQGPLYDKTDYSGKLGEILLTDGTAVFWRDISGIGTPLQTIGIWDENLFKGIVANLNFLDGNDPNNLVEAKIGISSKFADITISDRWALVDAQNPSSDVYRQSRVGINNNAPLYTLDLSGDLRVTQSARFTGDEQSTNITDGALTVVGGVGIGFNLNVGENLNVTGTADIFDDTTIDASLDVTGDVYIQLQLEVDSYVDVGDYLIVRSTEDSPNIGTGALVVKGGVGIEKSLSVGSSVSIGSPIESTNASNGALVVEGGVGIGKNLNVGDNVIIGGTDSSINKDSGALIVEGGVGIEENLNVGNDVTISGTTSSSDKDTGALVVEGGVGIEENLNVGNDVTISGTTSSIDKDTGALVVEGGVGIEENLNVGNDVTISGTTSSEDKDTGALVVEGGVGIEENLNVGNDFYLSGDAEIIGTLDVLSGNSSSDKDSGAVVITGGLGVGENINAGGYVTVGSEVDSTSKDTGALIVEGGVGIEKSLNVGNNASITSTLKVGVAGTVISTTGIGSVGFGTNSPKRDIEFNNKDVFFNQGAIYDSNENVGFRSEKYQVPRNVLTAVGVDTAGNIIPGRFYDAANLIRINLDFIANETIGFLTSTDYKNPPFVIVNSSGIATDPVNCKDDIKNILKAITYDITRGGNSQSVGAGLSYYSGNTLLHITGNDTNGYSVKDATIVAITTAAQLARYVVNNVSIPKSYQSIGSSIQQIKDLTLQDDSSVGGNDNYNGCANVVSAITVCAGIVTTIISNGPSAAPNKTNPDAKIVWSPAGADSKNIIYVSKYGNDDNDGRTEGSAKLTIGAAAEIAQGGDTIMVRSGFYIEENPIGLRTDVSITGQDLRLVTVCPQYDDDVFYVRRGCLIENLSFAFSRNPFYVGQNTPIVFTKGAAVAFPPPIGIGGARSGYKEPGPATEGITGRWRSPYIRNCTNFMSGSIGMKINGDHATASDIGADLKCMVCDSFTQYNENGIGVSITNNGYAQLVSIFTINSHIGIYCDTGGSCDLTNSNSSFGNYGLYAVGLGRTEFTGYVKNAPQNFGPTVTRTVNGVDAGSDKVTFSNVRDLTPQQNFRRPFDGQTLFFEIDLSRYPDADIDGLPSTILTSPMKDVREIKVKSGGSGFSAATPPSMVIVDKNSNFSQIPKGPQGFIAELSPNIDENGTITSVDVINSGRNYLPNQNLVVLVDGVDSSVNTPQNIFNVEIEVITQPIYYAVDAATAPTNTGETTVTFTTFIPYELFGGENVSFKRISRILTSSHSFEFIGTGTDINTATPFKGAVPIKENEVVALDGAQIPFTSTDQKGNFDIGEGFQVNQPTSVIRGRDFSRSIQAEVTPLILALR
jgi:hypothetical protein